MRKILQGIGWILWLLRGWLQNGFYHAGALCTTLYWHLEPKGPEPPEGKRDYLCYPIDGIKK